MMLIETNCDKSIVPTAEEVISKIKLGEKCYEIESLHVVLFYNSENGWIAKFEDDTYYGFYALDIINKIIKWLDENGIVRDGRNND